MRCWYLSFVCQKVCVFDFIIYLFMEDFKMKKVLILIALLTVSIGNITSAVTWDVNMDMDASANDPNGIWTYGYAEFDDPNDSNTVVYKGLLEDAGQHQKNPRPHQRPQRTKIQN